ncbi:hypothetical protein B0T19DRAFT_458665 [Cercophora scortea]|uniref:Uncharacterized protein n=1 Tax=Cercophora scortea TaxID=314031 RepID=A0AAE0IZI8_9PEZI|nr:hypothetical protein B0T19DRAFT_458665 [Cercophora scortea]
MSVLMSTALPKESLGTPRHELETAILCDGEQPPASGAAAATNEPFLDELRAQGVNAVTRNVNVAICKSPAEAIEEVAKTMPPIRGVFRRPHQGPEHMEPSPAFPGSSLDFFIMLSSLTGIVSKLSAMFALPEDEIDRSACMVHFGVDSLIARPRAAELDLVGRADRGLHLRYHAEQVTGQLGSRRIAQRGD